MCVLVTLIVVLQDETTPKQVFRRTIVETFEDQLSSSCEIVGSDILDDSSKQGMSPDPAKVAAIKIWPAPEDKSAVKSFLQTMSVLVTKSTIINIASWTQQQQCVKV